MELRPDIVPVSELSSLDGRVLGVIRFDESVAAQAGLTRGFVDISLPLPILGDDVAEVWRSDSDVRSLQDGELSLAMSDDFLFGAIVANEDDAGAAASRVYDAIVVAARREGFPNLLRVWNHVRGINSVDGELERYRSFCRGRHDAFASHGYGLRADLPAASAVGMREGSLATYFVASRGAAEQVENPRQVSAYDYPREYGPRSPSFSRATVAGSLVFISGTASIVGHESRHHGNVDAQLDETIENLERVSAVSGATLNDIISLKVYVRDRNDCARIAERLAPRIPAPAIYLEADICRAELLLEIEAVAKRR
ncbi:MAG: chorismate lyase / 3-hydroxybenzoate synthase [Acidobacteriota bacterium]|jgi:chorismate lyase/3-hydroxybenzoate synthase|nr:chorismate lyase / 3-hydroxybenzoate synthase [Acidobacteriota bacterium]